MAIEHLEDQLTLPFDEGAIRQGGEELVSYLRQLVSELERVALGNLHIVVNSLVDVSNTDWQYWGTRDPATGEWPDDSWRCGPVNGKLQWQKKVDGTWTYIQGIDAA